MQITIDNNLLEEKADIYTRKTCLEDNKDEYHLTKTNFMLGYLAALEDINTHSSFKIIEK